MICDHVSSTERKAIIAERKTTDRLIALIYQERVNEIIECVVLSVHKFGIFVSIDNGIADALMPVRELPYDWYEYNEKKQSLTGESNGLIFNEFSSCIFRSVGIGIRSIGTPCLFSTNDHWAERGPVLLKSQQLH